MRRCRSRGRRASARRPPARPRATATVAPVATNVLICPGPESEGLQGVPPSAGRRRCSPPARRPRSCRASTCPAASGNLTVTAEPAQTAVGSTEERGKLVQGPLTGASVGQVVGAWRARCGSRRPADHRRDRGRRPRGHRDRVPGTPRRAVAGRRRRRQHPPRAGRPDQPRSQHGVGRRHRAGVLRNPAVGQRPERRHPAPRPHEPARRRAGRPRVHPGRPRGRLRRRHHRRRRGQLDRRRHRSRRRRRGPGGRALERAGGPRRIPRRSRPGSASPSPAPRRPWSRLAP